MAGAVISSGPGAQGPYYPGAPGLYQSPQPAGQSTPKGYTWDEVQKKYVPYASSAQASQESVMRQREGQDAARRQQESLYGRLAQTGLGSVQMPQLSMPSMPGVSTAPTFSPPPQAASPALPDRVEFDQPGLDAANDAIFNRAKDREGQISRSAITGLQSSLASRGMLGSGKERSGTTDIIQQGQGALGNLTREQAIQQAVQAQKNAETAYSGGISQRGQDIAGNQQNSQAALAAWKAGNDAQLGQYNASLGAFGAGLDAVRGQQGLELDRARLNMDAQRANQQAVQGLMSSIRPLY